MRPPLRIYPRLSPRVPAYQDVTTAGSIGGGLSNGQSQFTEHWFIPDGRLVDFAEDVLGYSTKGNGVGLNRRLPAQHAELTYMWASRITSVEGYGSTGQRFAAAGSTASWKLLRVGVQYDTPPYRVVPNELVTKEWQRYIVPDADTQVEFIQRAKGAFTFYNQAPDGLAGRSFGRPGESGAGEVYIKTRITHLWVQLPDDGLFTEGGFDRGGRAAKIEAGLGRVNRFEFRGYDPGTLLLESWKPTPRVMPVPPTTLGLLPNDVPRSWDAQLVFSLFDPNPFDPNFRGHNLVPHPTKNLWIMAVRQGGDVNNDSDRIYQGYDFETLFEMN